MFWPLSNAVLEIGDFASLALSIRHYLHQEKFQDVQLSTNSSATISDKHGCQIGDLERLYSCTTDTVYRPDAALISGNFSNFLYHW